MLFGCRCLFIVILQGKLGVEIGIDGGAGGFLRGQVYGHRHQRDGERPDERAAAGAGSVWYCQQSDRQGASVIRVEGKRPWLFKK